MSLLLQVGSPRSLPSTVPGNPVLHTSCALLSGSGRQQFDLLLILYLKKIHNSITSGNNSSQSIIQNANPINIHSDQGTWI